MDFNSKIISILPHGSGINYEWNIEKKGGKVICRNAWDYMDNNGYYDDIFPFSVTFDHDDFSVKFHGLTSKQYRKINWINLREYLEDIFSDVRQGIMKVMEA